MNTRIRGLDQLNAKLDRIPAMLERVAKAGARRFLTRVQAAARSRVNVDSGLTRDSIVTEMAPDELSGRTGSNSRIAAIVHFGTRAHSIAPRRAAALRMNIGGRTVYAKAARHPGTAPNPFLLPAFEAEAPNGVQEIASDSRGALRELAG